MRLKSLKNLILALSLIVVCLHGPARADSTSTNKAYDLITTGTQRGQWGLLTNANWNLVDKNLGGYYTVSVAGSSNVAVSVANSANIYHKLTGVLTGSIQYTFPTAGGLYVVDNETSGAYTVTVNNTLNGTGVVVPQGAVNILYSDGTNSKVIAANASISGILASSQGGTGMAYWTAAGPTAPRAFAFPDANSTVLTTNAAVTAVQGGTGVATLAAHGVVLGEGTSPVAVSGAGTAGQALTSNGASADPTFQNIPTVSGATTSAAGIVQLATTVVAKAGTDATNALTAASIAGNSSLATSGYYTLPNGFTIEWGYYNGGAHGPTVTFPVAFATAAASVTANTNQTGGAVCVQITSISKTSWVADQRNSSGTAVTSPFYWMAIDHLPTAPNVIPVQGFADINYNLGLMAGALKSLQDGQERVLDKLDAHEKMLMTHTPAIQAAQDTLTRIDPVIGQLETAIGVFSFIGEKAVPIGKAFALFGTGWMVLKTAIPKAMAFVASLTHHG